MLLMRIFCRFIMGDVAEGLLKESALGFIALFYYLLFSILLVSALIFKFPSAVGGLVPAQPLAWKSEQKS